MQAVSDVCLDFPIRVQLPVGKSKILKQNKTTKNPFSKL